MNKRKKITSKGFTLIELMIVIVIIGSLMSAILPRITNMQTRAEDTANKSNINHISQAMELYSTENSGYPLATIGSVECISTSSGAGTASDAIKEYLKNERIPAPNREQTWEESYNSILYTAQCDGADGPSYMYVRAEGGYMLLSKIYNKGNANASAVEDGFPSFGSKLKMADIVTLFGTAPTDADAIYIQTN